MVRITDDHSKVASLKPEVREREPVVFYDRPIDSAWRYVVHGRRELWQCDSLFRESALRGLGGLVERLRRHSESNPGIGMELTYRDLTEPGWQERVGRELRDGEMWVAKQVAVRSIAFREHGILVDFVAEPSSTHAVPGLLDLLKQAANWCRGLVRRDEVIDPLLWWAFELVRLAWEPHPALQARRKFRHDVFSIDVEGFACPHAPGPFWSLVYELVGTAPRSWYAELSVDLASASAYLAERFIIKLEKLGSSAGRINPKLARLPMDLIAQARAAEKASVDPRTVKRWVRSGRLPTYGPDRKVSESEFERLLPQLHQRKHRA